MCYNSLILNACAKTSPSARIGEMGHRGIHMVQYVVRQMPEEMEMEMELELELELPVPGLALTFASLQNLCAFCFNFIHTRDL